MRKKNGFNIVFFVYMAIIFSIFSCGTQERNSEKGQLLKADSDFSRLSEQVGMYRAFLEYAADSTVLLRDDSYPVEGKAALSSLFEGRSDTSFVLTWRPVYEKISLSGDLGYTYGFYTRRVKATGIISRGTYLTIWEKQDDGTWRFVLDTGTEGLPE